MKVYVLLADKGTNNPQAGTLNLLNAGWGVTQIAGMTPQGPMTPAHTLAVFYEVDFHRCNRQMPLVVELVDEDGQPVPVPGGDGSQPMRFEQQIMVVPPPGAPTGTPGRGNFMLEISPGLLISPGSYSWHVSLDGEQDDDWSASFYVFPPPQPPTVGFPPPADQPPPV